MSTLSETITFFAYLFVYIIGIVILLVFPLEHYFAAVYREIEELKESTLPLSYRIDSRTGC